MSIESQELLMMFIKDIYKNKNGIPCKTTALTAMAYVNRNPELSRYVNNSDWRKVLKFNKAIQEAI